MKAIAIVLCLLSSCALGQNNSRIPIYVQCDCSSTLAMTYATALRDAVANSPRYSLSTESIKASNGGSNNQWILRIVAIPEGSQDIIAISVAFTFGDVFISNMVQTCGSEKVAECAKSTLSSADDDIIKIIQAVLSASRPNH